MQSAIRPHLQQLCFGLVQTSFSPQTPFLLSLQSSPHRYSFLFTHSVVICLDLQQQDRAAYKSKKDESVLHLAMSGARHLRVTARTTAVR